MTKTPLLVTREGRELLQLARIATREKLREIQSQKGDAADVGGNAWHDNFSFEHLVEQERVQQAELERQNKEFERFKLVDPYPKKQEILQIGHLATIEMEDGTVKTIEIVGHGEGDMMASPPKVVYLAPIVKDLFGQPVDSEAEVNLPSGTQTVVLKCITQKPKEE